MAEPGSEPGQTLPDGAPDWARGASPLTALPRGMLVLASTPGLILFFTSIGFGALARDAGLTLGHAAFIAASIYALPAQVVLADNVARGASLAAAAFAVTLTAVRLLPMTVSLMPLIRDGRSPRGLYVLAVHFVAITSWIEGNRRLPHLPAHLRLFFFIGIGLGMISLTITGGIIGHSLAGELPPVLSAALLFMTPLYFFLSLIATAQTGVDKLAIACGAALGPLFFVSVPGFDLMLAGLAGGTIAYFAGRRQRR